jgi:hypothetical protein
MIESEVAELVVMLSAAFPRPPMTQATCQLYEAMLKDLDRAAAHKACARLIATAKWLPTIAEIRAAAVEVEHGRRRLGMEAWGDVLEAIERVGFIPRFHPDHAEPIPPRPRFKDPVVVECVRDMGGWMSFHNMENETATRARFCDHYDKLAEGARREQVAGAALQLPTPSGASARQLRSVPGLAAIGRGGKG